MRLELFISVAAIVLLAVPAHARIPINGFGHVGEWRGAKTLYASPVEKAEALRDKEFLCLRLTRGTYLERRRLYIGHGSTRSHMLHVSSAISENDKIDGQSTYEFGVWGQNRGWTVNLAYNWIRHGKMVIVNPDAHEYQISV